LLSFDGTDFAFLAGLAYRRTNTTQSNLDAWFNGTMHDNPDIVRKWLEDNGNHSAVTFKLVTYNDWSTYSNSSSYNNSGTSKEFAYVLIRGTTDQWDMLTDAQLWTPTFLMQGIHGLLPFGFIWSPAIDDLIKIITKIESKSIKKVSFYKDTTKFIKYLLESDNYAGIILTGHTQG